MYKDKQTKYCDNSGHLRRAIHFIGCLRNKPTKQLTIDYGHETDVLDLCDDCTKAIRKDANSHGYKTSVKTL